MFTIILSIYVRVAYALMKLWSFVDERIFNDKCLDAIIVNLDRLGKIAAYRDNMVTNPTNPVRLVGFVIDITIVIVVLVNML